MEEALRDFGGELIPVDSEQSAIFQCLCCGRGGEIARLWLTASGGPFWQLSDEELSHVTVRRRACATHLEHGAKITIDSATLFNKGPASVIEASYLFHVPAECIDVLIHPQSIVHSMVEFADRSVMANLSCPDMRLPIQYAMTYPERVPSPVRAACRLRRWGSSRSTRWIARALPGCALPMRRSSSGGTIAGRLPTRPTRRRSSCSWRSRIAFTDIPHFVEDAMLRHDVRPARLMQDILEADEQARPQRRPVPPYSFLRKAGVWLDTTTMILSLLAALVLLGCWSPSMNSGTILSAAGWASRSWSLPSAWGPVLLQKDEKRHPVQPARAAHRRHVPLLRRG